ncbi:MAG: NADH-quinone oxidoreductase subunit NuoE [Phycisphaerales bacterium]
MPWITKDSANTQIPRRDEPYLTDAIKAEITSTYLPRYEKKQGALLPTLHRVQEEHGRLHHQALLEIAEFLELAPGEVIDTATFYEEYWLKPKGETVIAVCRSIACEVCDHKAITDCVRTKLGIDEHETTDDGKFTLVELECLGSCGTAPVALFNHTLHENLTPEKMSQLIDEYKAGKHGH